MINECRYGRNFHSEISLNFFNQKQIVVQNMLGFSSPERNSISLFLDRRATPPQKKSQWTASKHLPVLI